MLSYEWDVETTDEHGDVTDHRHSDRITNDCIGAALDTSGATRLVLVRDKHTARGGLDRSWAYVADGKLPEFFGNAYGDPETKVPQRYHKALARALNKPPLKPMTTSIPLTELDRIFSSLFR